MKTRMETLENEISSVKQRTASLEGQVGLSPPGAGAVAASPVEEAVLEFPSVLGESAVVRGAPSSPPSSAQGEEGVAQSRPRHRLPAALAAAAAAKRPLGAGRAGSSKERRSAEDEDAEEEDGPMALLALGAAAASESESGTGSIKGRLLSSEQEVASLKSRMTGLENAVGGHAFPSLVGQDVASGASASSLKRRMESLEDEVDSLRTRATALESSVTG
jgi:hypothetical protein